MTTTNPKTPHPPAAGWSGLSLAATALENIVADNFADENARHLTAAACTKFAEKDYAVAADLLGRALKLVPESAAAYSNLALVLWRANRSARAEVLARRAITLDPNHARAHQLLAEILCERGDV